MLNLFKKKTKHEEMPEIENNVPTLHDLFVPDGLEEKFDSLVFNSSQCCRTYVAAVYPREVNIGWLDEIFALGDVNLSVHIWPVPDRKVVYKLTQKVASARAQHTVDSRNGSILRLPQLEAIIRDLETVRAAVQNNRDKMFYVALLVTIHGRNEAELDRRSDVFEDILARRATYVRPLVMRQVEGLKSTIPVGTPDIQDFWRNLTSGGVAAMMPISNPDISHASGVFMGFNYFTGAPVFYDSFIGPPYLPNPHISCFGYSGSGKSTTLKVITGRSVLAGIRCVVIDLEGEYRNMVENLLGGKCIRIVPGEKSGINLLELEPEESPDGVTTVNITDKVADVRAVISSAVQHFANRKLDPAEIIYLEEALREEYAARGINSNPKSLYERQPAAKNKIYTISPVKKQMPVITDLYHRLQAKPGAENLAVLLKPFLAGNSLGMFDCQTETDLNAPIVSFDAKEIKEEFTRFYAMTVILSWAWQKFAQRNRNVRKRIILDEAWMFMKYPDSAASLERFARRGRKHNTSLVVASQQIEEFLSREQGRAVINNCATLILLQQSPNVADQVVDVFNLASGSKQLLETFAPGQCLVSFNGAVTAVNVAPTPYEWPYVTTNPETMAE